MTWQGWTSVGVIAAVFLLLMLTTIAPDVVMIAGVTVLLLVGILTPNEALSGLANEGMVTVGVLFIVGAGVRGTGGIDWVASRLLGQPKSVKGALARLIAPMMFMSMFMNNTPQVAMMIPVVADWAKKIRVSASKLMIPLSYATILGGCCTLIGTSTNLVVNGLLETSRIDGFRMFDLMWIGLPTAIVGGVYIVVFEKWLLPTRQPSSSPLGDPRQYTIEMLVSAESPLVGKSIADAGLRHLPGVFLAEIERGGTVMPAVSHDERLHSRDRLIFVGVIDSVVDLQRIRGLEPATDQVFKLEAPRSVRCLVEAVVSDSCPMLGKTIRDVRFRSTYGAVVIAVARNGERINRKIGDISLRAGDTLLLEALPSFVEQQRNNRDFYLVSRLEDSNPPRHEKAVLSVVILAGMVLAASVGWLSMLQASMLAAGLMLVTRCVRIGEARRSVAWDVLLAIAASFGLSTALEKTGAARIASEALIGLAGGDPWMTLALVYLGTLLATELISNNAAAALVFPFALSAARDLGVSHVPFMIAIMMAASNGFATPIGYQTNLMVYGPGGYRFSDYLRIGVPLDLLAATVTISLTPLVFPFTPVG